jgi:hypothetical protein
VAAVRRRASRPLGSRLARPAVTMSFMAIDPVLLVVDHRLLGLSE